MCTITKIFYEELAKSILKGHGIQTLPVYHIKDKGIVFSMICDYK